MRILYSLCLIFITACGGSQTTESSNNTNSTSNQTNSDINTEVTPVVTFLFDEETNSFSLNESRSKVQYRVNLDGAIYEAVPGVLGNAFRTNGFSTWLNAPIALPDSDQLTIEFWTILEAYPGNQDTVYDELINGSLISKRNSRNGFDFPINSYGQWGFEVSVDGQFVTINAPDVLPLNQWNHIVAIVNELNQSMTLYLNGNRIASRTFSGQMQFTNPQPNLLIGKSWRDNVSSNIVINAINGAYDEFHIWDQPLASDTIRSRYLLAQQTMSDATSALQVSPERFTLDFHRPRVRAMPPANWTNEPHGLIQVDGIYHMFYQRTASAPLFMHKTWGHLQSSDLVNWESQPDALWPTLTEANFGIDMKGIWSGNVFHEQGETYAFYTSVNHTGPFNPGIAYARAIDNQLIKWEKLGGLIPKEDVRDFRDPYIWKDDNLYHMIIGAQLNEGHGGLLYYTSTDLINWVKQDNFTTLPMSEMDIGSTIWEMPVFVSLQDDIFALVVNPIGNTVSRESIEKPTRAVYWLGHWNGRQFSPFQSEPINLDIIHGHLSPTVTRNTDDELVSIGIVDERRSTSEQVAAGWTQTFSLPRVWSLSADQNSIKQQPYAGLKALRQNQLKNTVRQRITNHDLISAGHQLEVIINIDDIPNQGVFGLELGYDPITQKSIKLLYDVDTHTVTLDTRNSSINPNVDKDYRVEQLDTNLFSPPQKWHVIIDHSNIDVFFNDHYTTSFRMYPDNVAANQVRLVSESPLIASIKAWQLSLPNQIPQGYLNTSLPIRQGLPFQPAEITSLLGSFNNALTMLSSEGWTVEGDFANPTNADSWFGTATNHKIGTGAVSTCEINANEKGCDGARGAFISPIFEVDPLMPWLSFLIAGGDGSENVYVELINAQTGKRLWHHSPSSCSPSYINGGEDWMSIDLQNFIGQPLILKFVDDASEGCGFISFDHIHLRNQPLE